MRIYNTNIVIYLMMPDVVLLISNEDDFVFHTILMGHGQLFFDTHLSDVRKRMTLCFTQYHKGHCRLFFDTHLGDVL